jgi:hypothetical protein
MMKIEVGAPSFPAMSRFVKEERAMSTQSRVFLKQLVDNAEFANEAGVLTVIALFRDPDPEVRQGTEYAAGAFDTLVRLLELRPDLATAKVVAELRTLSHDSDQSVRLAAEACLSRMPKRDD